jgi:hypothetical protein
MKMRSCFLIEIFADSGFPNYYSLKPLLPSGFFLKKKPPCTNLARTHEIWKTALDGKYLVYRRLSQESSDNRGEGPNSARQPRA